MNERGFTFIELTLAIVIISSALFGLLTLFQNVVTFGNDSEEYLVSSVLAQERLEEIVADKTNRGYNYIVNNNYPQENLAVPFAGYIRTTTITEVRENDLITAQNNSGYKRVVVSVTPPGGTTMTYQTLLTLWGIPIGP